MQSFRRVILVAFLTSSTYLTGPVSARTEVLCPRACQEFSDAMVAHQARAYLNFLSELWFGGVIASSPHSTCVKAHESATAGGYSAVSSTGKYRGAHQWDRETWSAASSLAGYPEWSTTPVNLVPPFVQELSFGAWAQVHGDRPWLNRCVGLWP